LGLVTPLQALGGAPPLPKPCFSFALPSLMLPFDHIFITHNVKEKKNETAKDARLKGLELHVPIVVELMI